MLTVPKRKGHTMLPSARGGGRGKRVGQEAEGARGKLWARAFIAISARRFG